MASTVYPKFKEACVDGTGIDLTSVNVKLVLIDTADYSYSAAHDFLDDIPAGARVGTSANLGTKTVTNGAFGSDNTTMTAVTGDESEALAGYIDTGTASTSRLIWFDDGSTGLPITPNGEDINVTAPASWFAL